MDHSVDAQREGSRHACRVAAARGRFLSSECFTFFGLIDWNCSHACASVQVVCGSIRGVWAGEKIKGSEENFFYVKKIFLKGDGTSVRVERCVHGGNLAIWICVA